MQIFKVFFCINKDDNIHQVGKLFTQTERQNKKWAIKETKLKMKKLTK